MTLSESVATSRSEMLGQLESGRAAFLAALASVPDAALAYRGRGENDLLGSRVEHVAGIVRYYTNVLAGIREAGFGTIQVADPSAAITTVSASKTERGPALRRLQAAHAALLDEILNVEADDFRRTARVTYGSAESPCDTSAADVVTWVDQRYREDAERISKLLEEREKAEHDAAQLLQRFGATFNSGNLNAIMALMTDDCVFEDTEPAPDGTRYVGAAQVRAAFAAFFACSSAPSFTTEEMFTCGDRAVVRWRYEWDGGHVRGVDVFKLRDGRIAEKLAYVKG